MERMKDSKSKRTLLVIDDDRVFGEAVRDYLSGNTVEVLLAFRAADGLTLCSLKNIDVVVLDQQLPDAEGHTICPTILKYNEQTKIIFSTAFPSFDNAIKAIRSGAHDYLSKPYDLEELALAVKQAFRTLELEHVEQIQDYQRAQERKDTVLIGGTGFAETQRLMEQAASTDSPVLITGETGTGKTLLAKTIHYQWRGGKAPFISINCASLPENLVEAELFGYEKGAFTGAVGAKKGLFEMADGGTLFLDEIGEIPFHLQAKLLSAIEEKVIRRVGGTTMKSVNVRVMAATSMELEKALGNDFRKDLYYRLSVVRIHMPPLRERREDISALCSHLIKSMSGREVAITDSEMARLMEYEWPGNIRELRNVLERALFIQRGPLLQPSLLLEKQATNDKPCAFPGTADTRIRTLDECEREIIGSALKQLSGNLTQTAKALGISLSTLKRKIKEFGLMK